MNIKKYTEDHEWILPEESFAIVGITNHAQENLGDIVFIELPQISKIVKAGDQIGIVESVKAASNVATVVASIASILLSVAVPEESVRISVPLMEIPMLASKSIPPSSISSIFVPSTLNLNNPK